jgi:hypothetical protein
MLAKRDFVIGWTLLIAQPYAAYLTRDPDKTRLQAQERLFQEIFGEVTAVVWQQAVRWWIEHEDHWPLIPELRQVIGRLRPKPPVTPAPSLTHGPAIPLTERDLIRFAEQEGITVFEAVKRWPEIAAHPAMCQTD